MATSTAEACPLCGFCVWLPAVMMSGKGAVGSECGTPVSRSTVRLQFVTIAGSACGKCGKCRIQHPKPSQTIPHFTRHGCLDVGSAITTPQSCLVGSHHCKWVDLPFPSSTRRYAFTFWAWKGKMQAFQWFHDCILSGNNAMQKSKTTIFGQTSSSTRRVTYFYATMNHHAWQRSSLNMAFSNQQQSYQETFQHVLHTCSTAKPIKARFMFRKDISRILIDSTIDGYPTQFY